MSRHHKARCMEGAATMQETSYNTHHASYITSHNSAYTTCCVDIAPGMYLCVLHVLMVCSLCYIWLPTTWWGPPLTVRNWYIYIIFIHSNICIEEMLYIFEDHVFKGLRHFTSIQLASSSSRTGEMGHICRVEVVANAESLSTAKAAQ